jgi:hypothetical protein
LSAPGLGRNLDLFYSADIRPCLTYFTAKQILILLFFRDEFQIPALNLGPLVEELPIQVNTHPSPGMLFVEYEGISTNVYNLKPTIPDGTGSEKLDRVWKAFCCLAYDIVFTFLGEIFIRIVNHVASYQHARRGTSMKGGDHSEVFLETI